MMTDENVEEALYDHEEFSRQWKQISYQRYLEKLKRLDGISATEKEKVMLQGWHRDDSFLGNPAKRHIMYKLGQPLVSCDGNRAYEFLIEFDVNDPSIGIYYGVKGLILDGNLRQQIEILTKEFYGVSIEDYLQQKPSSNKEWPLYILISKYLNATFPGKDFAQRFRVTDNANDNTFWPFWIAADPEEDIIWETARAVSIIRRIYHERVNNGHNQCGLFELSDSSCPISEDSREKLKSIGEENSPLKSLQNKKLSLPENNVRSEYLTTIRFSNQTYDAFMLNLGSERARRIFKELISSLIYYKMIHQSSLLENGYEIEKDQKISDIARLLRMFWDVLEEDDKKKSKYKNYSSLFHDVPSIFIPENMEVMVSKNIINYANKAKDVMGSKSYSGPLQDLRRIVKEAVLKYEGKLK